MDMSVLSGFFILKPEYQEGEPVAARHPLCLVGIKAVAPQNAVPTTTVDVRPEIGQIHLEFHDASGHFS